MMQSDADRATIAPHQPASLSRNTLQTEAAARVRINTGLDRLVFNADVPLAAEAAQHFSRKGKTLRGVTTLLVADALSSDQTASRHWALAVECLHNASLVHDDVCDRDRTRRHGKTVWAEFGAAKAICFGDWLVAQAFDQAARSAETVPHAAAQLTRILADTMATLSIGQSREFDRKPVLDWFGYDRIVYEKTAPLLSAAVLGPVCLAGRHDLEERLLSLMKTIGIAYQMANDLMDGCGQDGGRDAFSDFRRGNPNAVVVSFASDTSSPDYSAFRQWYADMPVHGFDHWVAKIRRSEAITEVKSRLHRFVAESETILKTFEPPVQTALLPLFKYLRQTEASVLQKQNG